MKQPSKLEKECPPGEFCEQNLLSGGEVFRFLFEWFFAFLNRFREESIITILNEEWLTITVLLLTFLVMLSGSRQGLHNLYVACSRKFLGENDVY